VLPGALNYNGLTCLFVDSAAGLLFSLLADEIRARDGLKTSATTSIVKAVAMGVLVGFCLFSKLTSFAAFLFISASVAGVVLRRPFLARTFVGVCIGICLVLIVYGAYIQDLRAWLQAQCRSLKGTPFGSGTNNGNEFGGINGPSSIKRPIHKRILAPLAFNAAMVIAMSFGLDSLF